MITENTLKQLKDACDRGDLLIPARENIEFWLNSESLPTWAISSIQELLNSGAWSELNDRFYKNLTFGTGGMRSRTIGKIVTTAERGILSKDGAFETCSNWD